MNFRTRRLVRPTDLNGSNRLFGGQLLAWVDEEAAIFTACQMRTCQVVTRLISEIEFLAPVLCGDVLEFGLQVSDVGTTSLSVHCEVRSKLSGTTVLRIGRMVFVAVDEAGRPVAHGLGRAVA